MTLDPPDPSSKIEFAIRAAYRSISTEEIPSPSAQVVIHAICIDAASIDAKGGSSLRWWASVLTRAAELLGQETQPD